MIINLIVMLKVGWKGAMSALDKNYNMPFSRDEFSKNFEDSFFENINPFLPYFWNSNYVHYQNMIS